VAAGVFGFHEGMGTHRLPIHLVAFTCAAAYPFVARPGGREATLRALGLGRPRRTGWVWALLAAGAGTGVLRYALYRHTGLGGVRLYEQEFLPQLRGSSAAGEVLLYALFLPGLYVAVLVPAVLFLGVIQGPFARAGWFPAGLLLQSGVFAYAHSYMTGTFDPVYGAEAFCGAAVSGVAYQRLGEVFVPSLFMTSSVFASAVMLGLFSP
jgi:membrane protease YdiL (CAAX protease family)